MFTNVINLLNTSVSVLPKSLLVFGLMITLSACQEDLVPDDSSLSQDATGMTLEDFSVSLNTDSQFELTQTLTTKDAVVLYFTMWCPICDSHMTHIRNHLVDAYPNVSFVMVDYVSGSLQDSRSSQMASGYGDFEVIADTDDALQDLLQGTMGSIVVIDKNQVVLLNEYFKNDTSLMAVLDNL
jgi:thiol-disulfide isomerase/thioredoxin